MSSRSLNKVFLMGNLTRDPELRYTAGGTPIATFTIATNRNYKDSTGKVTESAEFTPIVVWGKLAEICGQLLKKGMKVFVEGRLQTSKWNDKETGKEVRRTEVVATDMQIVSQPSGMRSDMDTSQESAHTEGTMDDSSVMGEDVNLDPLAIGITDLPEQPAGGRDTSSNSTPSASATDDTNNQNDSSSVPF